MITMMTQNPSTTLRWRGGAPPVAWDRSLVQDLIEEAHGKNEQPTVLVLGQREAEALRAYLGTFFGDEAQSLEGLHYAGLRVVLSSVPRDLRVETMQSIFRSSRHNPEHQAADTARQAWTEDAATFRLALE